MILQALYEYYQRKSDLPREGFEIIRLKFIIVIKEDGTFVDLVDQRDGKQGKEYLLPKSKGRTSPGAWRITFLLWDHYGYVLSHPKDSEKKSVEMAKKQNNVFVNSIKNLPEELKKDVGVNAVLAFYEKNQLEEVKKHPRWQDCSKVTGCNLTFKLDGHSELVPQRNALVEYQAYNWDKQETNGKKIWEAPCLITGLKGPVVILHTATPIPESKSKSTAKIIGIQKNSGYDSYKKQQAYNAPVSIKAEYAYTTALKHLIHSTTNHVVISDMSILFWAEQQTVSFEIEQSFVYMISPKDDPDKGVRVVEALFNAIKTGQLPYDGNSKFYVLGLAAPTPARISIRMWNVGTVREFGERIIKHFKGLQLDEHDYYTLYEILASISVETKDRKKPSTVFFRGKCYDVQPNLSSEIIRSILEDRPYPVTLLHQCIRRIRAEVARKDKNGKLLQNVTRPRAAILKAYLNRINKNNNHKFKEIQMALDKENKEVGYVLGRLFAMLERIQEESAKPRLLNSTIRERYYGSFSSSPIVVLQALINLNKNHLSNLSKNGKVGLKKWFDSELGEIFDLLKPISIPAHLTLEQQAFFAVGYYHQKNYKEDKTKDQSTK